MAIETPATIAVLGAGPIGLEAALYARYLGYSVAIYERGRVAEHVRRFGHVRMFTPFGQNTSPLGIAALVAQDPSWRRPRADELLTGAEYLERYLLPLAQSDLLAESLHESSEVLAVGRDGPIWGELTEEDARADCDFRLLVRTVDSDGHQHEHVAAADAVIDCAGTLRSPNWLGHGGIPAIGELVARCHVEYGLPDVLGGERGRYAGRNVLVLGSGDSAAANVVALAELAAQTPDTWITWVTRAADGADGPLTIMADDPLSERKRLATLANRLAADDANHITHLAETSVQVVRWHADLDRFDVELVGKHAGAMEFDRVIANVGYRADHGLASELDLRPVDAGGLLRREVDYYILGAKSADRDPRFYIAEGLRQIRALFAIIGDRAELDLYAAMPRLS